MGFRSAEICRKAGISQATYFNWKKKWAGMMPSEMKRVRELEQENARLKKIVADLTLDREMLPGHHQTKNLRPGRKRTLVDTMRSEWAISIQPSACDRRHTSCPRRPRRSNVASFRSQAALE